MAGCLAPRARSLRSLNGGPYPRAARRSFHLDHQLDFVTPGSSPMSARSRKQIRHNPNLRM